MDALKALDEYQMAVDDYIDCLRRAVTHKELTHRKAKMAEKRRELSSQIKELMK